MTFIIVLLVIVFIIMPIFCIVYNVRQNNAPIIVQILVGIGVSIFPVGFAVMLVCGV